MTYKGTERRKSQRSPLVTFCPAFFEYGGKKHSAMMLNVSPAGAGFRSEKSEEDLHFISGETISFTIKTPYGESSCSGIVIWSTIIGNHYSWGIGFQQLSEETNDPLRLLIDSSF